MNQKANLKSDVNFLFEMGNIRFIERFWRRFLHDDFANVAEHHFRVFWIAMVIASHEKDVDTGKIAKMAILHDITESRTGEVDYISRQYVERKEQLAINDILAGTIIENEFYALWEEYETRTSLEAKIVKDADNLDVDLELAEQAAKGSQLQRSWKDNRAFVAKERLFTATAKRIFDQLADADPHEWHLSGRNRRKAGDWKQ